MSEGLVKFILACIIMARNGKNWTATLDLPPDCGSVRLIGNGANEVSAARAILAAVEHMMAFRNDGEVMENIHKADPKLAARTLLKYAGRNKRADEIIGHVFQNKDTHERAAKIAASMTRGIDRVWIKGDTTVMEHAVGPMPASLYVYLPNDIKMGAIMLSASELGSKPATDTIMRMMRAAKGGDEKAKATVKMLAKAYIALRDANVVGAEIPLPTSPFVPKASGLLEKAQAGDADAAGQIAALVAKAKAGDAKAATAVAALVQAASQKPAIVHVSGDEVGFSLYNDLLKNIDPTRPENSALRGLISIAPFGGAALAAVDVAAKANAVTKAKTPAAAAKAATAPLAAVMAKQGAVPNAAPIVVAPPASEKPATPGLWVPTWESEEGKSIRNAPTAVLFKMREAAQSNRPYGKNSTSTMRVMLPLVEEEIAVRGAKPVDAPVAEEAPGRNRLPAWLRGENFR